MQKRIIGKSNIKVSALTLGCMSLGTEQQTAINIIDQAIDAGINHLDTADLYDYGKNEEIIGKAIKTKRDQLILTSKVGNHFDKEKQTHFWDPSKEHIEHALKASLNRLQTDYLDFYLLHGGTIDDPIDETIETFELLKKAGYIRAYGISSIRPNVIREYMNKSTMDVVMMQYSLLDRRPEALFADLRANNISVVARGPLAKGMLTTTGLPIVNEKAHGGYLDYSSAALTTTMKQLQQATPNLTGAALHYPLQDPVVASTVFGASSSKQLQENITTFNHFSMTDNMYQSCKAVTKQFDYHVHK